MAPHAPRPACEAAPAEAPCSQAACNGINRTTCNGVVGESVQCREASCSDGVAILAESCDGHGSCPAIGPDSERPCDPFGCGADVCNTTCAVSDELRERLPLRQGRVPAGRVRRGPHG